MRLLAIDPGSDYSAYVVFDSGVPTKGEWLLNSQLLQMIREGLTAGMVLAIETLHPRGELASRDAMTTQLWAGRFIEAAEHNWQTRHVIIDPNDARVAVTGDTKSKDKHIRQAIIDYYGGDNAAIGGVKCPACKGNGWVGRGRPTCEACQGRKWLHPPGVLHRLQNNHFWSAMAAGLCYWQRQQSRKATA